MNEYISGKIVVFGGFYKMEDINESSFFKLERKRCYWAYKLLGRFYEQKSESFKNNNLFKDIEKFKVAGYNKESFIKNQQPRPKGTGYVGSDRYGLYAGSNAHEPKADAAIETALKGGVLDPPANKNKNIKSIIHESKNR